MLSCLVPDIGNIITFIQNIKRSLQNWKSQHKSLTNHYQGISFEEKIKLSYHFY